MHRATSRRAIQMADQIMHVLARILVEEAEDPALRLVTVTGVRMNRDFSIAEVLVTHVEGPSAETRTLHGLQRAKGFLRLRLGQELSLRAVPDLRFAWDTFLENMVYDPPAAPHR
jgi:ribosome-binding factor A